MFFRTLTKMIIFPKTKIDRNFDKKMTIEK